MEEVLILRGLVYPSINQPSGYCALLVVYSPWSITAGNIVRTYPTQ